MDNVCHTLVGAALGEAGLKHQTRFGAVALLVAANLPDVDALVFATGTSSVAFRRGWTHGIGAQLLLPAALAGAFWLAGRRAQGGSESRSVHLGWLLVLSYAGVFSHVFLDYLNNYGIRLLTPFDWRWFYGDAVFIVDPWLWLVLGMGVWMARRHRAPALSASALLLAACYIGAMLMGARSARGVVLEYWREAHGTVPRALMVGPVLATPFTRDVIVDAGNHYETGRFSWPSSVSLNPEPIPKNDERPEVAAARAAQNVSGFLVWSRFPCWTLENVEQGTRVTVSDLRFMARGGIFSASTVVPVMKTRRQ